MMQSDTVNLKRDFKSRRARGGGGGGGGGVSIAIVTMATPVRMRNSTSKSLTASKKSVGGLRFVSAIDATIDEFNKPYVLRRS